MHAPNGSSIYIQYHPGSGHHGVMPYYKISSGKNGISDTKIRQKSGNPYADILPYGRKHRILYFSLFYYVGARI